LTTILECVKETEKTMSSGSFNCSISMEINMHSQKGEKERKRGGKNYCSIE